MKQNVSCNFRQCNVHSSVFSTFNSHISKKHYPHDASELNMEVMCESVSNDVAGEMNQSSVCSTDVDSESDCNANLTRKIP